METAFMQSFYDHLRAAGVALPDRPRKEKDIDARWRTLTEAGNRARAAQDHVGALHIYEAALAEAERMFEAAIDGGSALFAPMIYNISCANQAEAMLRSGDNATARTLLLRAFDRLLTTAGSATSPVALRINCVRHLGYPFEILARDFADDMDQPDMQRLLARVAPMMQDVQRVTGWMIQQSSASESHDMVETPLCRHTLQ
jgi:hypothetical protein